MSDYDLDARDEDQIRLHSVSLSAGAYACGKRLIDLWLQGHDVQIKSIRRRNLKPQEPAPDTVLAENDVLVLEGTPDNLALAEKILLTGQ